MRIVILSGDNYFKKHEVSLDEILSYGDYGAFLGDAISKGLKPVKALRMLYKNGSSFLELRERLKKHDISVELYFIAPFGVLRENDLITIEPIQVKQLCCGNVAIYHINGFCKWDYPVQALLSLGGIGADKKWLTKSDLGSTKKVNFFVSLIPAV